MSEAILRRARARAARAEALAVTRLSLTDFRCYAGLRLALDPAPVVLVGPNGAGKTNILEALSLLVPGRGLRRARHADLLRREAGPEGSWAVAATVATPSGEMRLGTGREIRAEGEADDDGEEGAPPRRLVRIEGQAARGPAALGEWLRAVWLTPEMDGMFLAGASARRRFLDRAICGLDPAHASRVGAYERALRQRARLLREGGGDPLWLSALEDRMACEGVAIAAARLHTVERLGRIAAAGFGPFPGATLALSGLAEGWLAESPALEVETRLRALWEARRAHDAAAGLTEGPHRSDLCVRHRAKDMTAAQCSTGEQKALMVALVLAVVALQAEETGAAPLVLLDEIAAHLDAARRAALFEKLVETGAQAWLTGTEGAAFAGLAGRAQFLEVDEGRVRAV